MNQKNTLKQSNTTTNLMVNAVLSRNALGDIGNRICLANKQQQQGKDLKKEITIEQQQQQQQVVSSNNSCIMVEAEDEVEEIELDEDINEDEEEIVDIDQCDSENTQLASEYVKDIYKYLNLMEKKFRIQSNFLENKIVTSKMRSVLIDWLIQVHLKFHLLQETLYLCVQIIDAYLQVKKEKK